MLTQDKNIKQFIRSSGKVGEKPIKIKHLRHLKDYSSISDYEISKIYQDLLELEQDSESELNQAISYGLKLLKEIPYSAKKTTKPLT